MLYRFLRSLLFLLPAETAHHVGFAVLRLLQAVPLLKRFVAGRMRPRDPALVTQAMGLRFDSPVGLAAGFDKEARGYEGLWALGFGSVEVGTLTALAQPGNPKPRVFRLKKDRALINRMGFNNHGAEEASGRLRGPRSGVVGVNVGKSKVTPEAQAPDDYATSTRLLAPLADYFVVNVSSPNTPGLRNLQAVDQLRPLLARVQEVIREVRPDRPLPLLVKIAPDLADEDVDQVADLALELGLDGIIATNTTIGRAGLKTDPVEVQAIGAGGLSGAPLAARSLEVLRRLRARVGDRLVLVAAGGIESADDAWERIRAGATLVQVYTAFVYEGPGFAKRLNDGLVARARQAGYSRVQDAVGTAATSPAASNRQPAV